MVSTAELNITRGMVHIVISCVTYNSEVKGAPPKYSTCRAHDVSPHYSHVDSLHAAAVCSAQVLHRLAAHALIDDFERGVLDHDAIQQAVMKRTLKQRVIDLSKTFSIVTPYTSFVAIEERVKVRAHGVRF